MKNKTRDQMLREYIQEQMQCYAGIMPKLQEQKTAIEQNDDRRLLAVIAEKDALIGAILKIDGKIAALVDSMPASTRQAVGRELGGLLRRLEEAYRKIVAVEKECQEALERKKAVLGHQLKEVQHGKSMLKGYTPISKKSIFSENI